MSIPRGAAAVHEELHEREVDLGVDIDRSLARDDADAKP
jgi:hypothetical protein